MKSSVKVLVVLGMCMLVYALTHMYTCVSTHMPLTCLSTYVHTGTHVCKHTLACTHTARLPLFSVKHNPQAASFFHAMVCLFRIVWTLCLDCAVSS